MANDHVLMFVGPALQDSGAPTWLMTLSGDLICNNSAFGQVLGLQSTELASLPFLGAIVPDANQIGDLLAKLAAGTDTYAEGRIVFRRHDGTHSDHDCVFRPVISNGRAVAVLGRIRQSDVAIFNAISPPDKMDVQTRHSLNTLGMLTQTVGIATWFADFADRKMQVSDNYYEMLGYEVGEIALDSKWVRSQIHPDDLGYAVQQMEDMVANRSDAYRVAYRLRCKDRSWKWFYATGHVRQVDGPSPSRVIYGSLMDISDRKADEARLQEALRDAETAYAMIAYKEEMHRVATESGGIAPWNIDPITRTAWWSEGLHRLLGYENNELPPISSAFRDLIHPNERDTAVASLNAVTEGKSNIYDADFRVRRKDGTWIWCQSTARLVARDHLGLHPLLCGSLKDITPRKLFEQQIETALIEAEKARDDAMAARAAAQRNEEILRVSSESGNVVPWTRTPETGESWFGPNLNKLLGIPPETVIESAYFRTLLHPDDQLRAANNHLEIEEGNRNDYAQDFRVLHADGNYRWFSSKGRRVYRTDQGLPDMVCGSLTNIDNLKENEERLAQVAAAAEAARAKAQASEDMLRASAVSGSIGPWNVCPETNECWMMDVTYRMMGYDPGDFVPNSDGWRNLIHPEDAGMAIANMVGLISGETEIYDVSHRLRHKDGSYHWYRGIARRIDRSSQGLPMLIAGATTPIAHLKENEARLAEAADAAQRISDRLRSIANNAPAGLFEFRLFPDGSSDLPFTSARFDDLIGFDEADDEAPKSFPFDQIHPEDAPAVLASIQQSAETLGQWSQRFRLMHPRNGQIWLSGSSTPKQHSDNTIVWIGTVHDVTNDVKREAELREAHLSAEKMRAENEKQALHDVLTELPNRRFFDQALADRLAAARAGDGPKDCVLIRIDADRFKYINDTLGHEAGDVVLMRIALIIKNCIRASDFGARIGGDEFSIILAAESDEQDAKAIVDRIQALMAEPLVFNGRQCHIQASFGIAHVADISAMGTEIQSFADAALYRAKEKGRNRMEFFTPDLHRDFLDGQSLASELHDAFENDEFIPFFQPQVSARDGSLTGVETLVRWQHPQKGILTPDKFLKVAEQLKMVADIDRMMVEKSSEVLDRLRSKNVHLPKISFNVSSGRMHDPEMINQAQRITLRGTSVTFELVESILVEEEGAEFKQHLQRISAAGIDIEIDDFGSGHASIIGLMEVLPSALKIDRRIVMPVAEKKAAAQLVKAIIQIADALDIHTVAEGVETEAQAKILRDLGCDVFQGYLFAKPLSEVDLERYLKRQ